MKYIALLYGEPDAGPVPGTPEFMQMLGEFQSATAAMAGRRDRTRAVGASEDLARRLPNAELVVFETPRA